MHYYLTLKAQSELSHWELSHIMNVIGNAYMKLTILHEMQKLYNQGATDQDFIIGQQSLSLHHNIHSLSGIVPVSADFDHTIQNRKSRDANSFWQLFHRLHRPVVFYRTENGYKSLYDYDNALFFHRIETNSPPSLTSYGKSISVELAKMVISAVIGIGMQEMLIVDNTEQLLEQHERIFLEHDGVMESIEEIRRNQQILLERDNQRLSTTIEEVDSTETIEYEHFLREQKNLIENRFNKQIEKTPIIVENFVVG